MEDTGEAQSKLSRRQFLSFIGKKAPIALVTPLIFKNAIINQTEKPEELDKAEADNFLAESTDYLTRSIFFSRDKKTNQFITPVATGATLFKPEEKTETETKIREIEDPFNGKLGLKKLQYDDPFEGKLSLKRPQLKIEEKQKGLFQKLWTRRETLAALGAGAATVGALSKLAIPLIPQQIENLKDMFKLIEVEAVAYDPNKIFKITSTPIPATPKPTSTPVKEITPTPTKIPTKEPTKPTPIPEKTVKEIVGNRNLAEFFLSDLVDKFKTRRLERIKNPATAERIDKDLLKSDNIFTLYTGIDETRDRPNAFSGSGWGRSDIIILTSFNIHTFKTTAISIPRDLFAPELAKYFLKKQNDPNAAPPKVNSMTMVEYMKAIGEIKENVDPNDLIKTIIESATGCPIDMMIKTNIDFMQGSWDSKVPGIFDKITPNGIKVLIPEGFTDKEYPTPGEGDETIVFEKGWQTLAPGHMPKRSPNPQKGGYTNPDTVSRAITAYARSRKGDSDFARSDRQRQILSASFKIIAPGILKDLTTGNPKTLDTLISALEEQQQAADLFFDTNIIEILRTLNTNIMKLRETPRGTAALGVLIANTANTVNGILNEGGDSFVSFGPTYEDGLQSVDKNDPNYWFAESKPTGSQTDSKPTQLGNYLTYWEPLRQRIITLMKR